MRQRPNGRSYIARRSHSVLVKLTLARFMEGGHFGAHVRDLTAEQNTGHAPRSGGCGDPFLQRFTARGVEGQGRGDRSCAPGCANRADAGPGNPRGLSAAGRIHGRGNDTICIIPTHDVAYNSLDPNLNEG